MKSYPLHFLKLL